LFINQISRYRTRAFKKSPEKFGGQHCMTPFSIFLGFMIDYSITLIKTQRSKGQMAGCGELFCQLTCLTLSKMKTDAAIAALSEATSPSIGILEVLSAVLAASLLSPLFSLPIITALGKRKSIS